MSLPNSLTTRTEIGCQKKTKMGIKQQAVTEHLEGDGYRRLTSKSRVSRTTINKWV